MDLGREGSKRIETDALGKFAYAPLAPGLVQLRVLRIGYVRWQDTIKVVADERPDLEICLNKAILDGPCGFGVVIVRKPWWKFW